ncbi:MAG: sigma 54-interacting transcriptional regulator [Candidatus Schekmanbacteria bacterium]|nr:sigma 54-interacting transcriptional regulator [Candidatus Schekmanbacteria bacterium]
MSALDTTRLWSFLRQVLARVTQSCEFSRMLDEAVDGLVELFDADRGLIIHVDASGAQTAIQARSRGRNLRAHERAEISKTIVDRVLRTRELQVFDIGSVHADGEVETRSLVSFGILYAVAAPIVRVTWLGEDAARGRATPGLRGVIYLDYRRPDVEVGALHLEAFRTVSEMLALLLESSEEISATRRNLGEALERLDLATAPTLQQLLAPGGMAHLRDEVLSFARSDVPMLIQGETGVGKTLMAKAIAKASHRPTPFVRVDLGQGTNPDLARVLLFGSRKGAFTDAGYHRGKVEEADGGTLFMDEVANLPLPAQQLLLVFLEDGYYEPVGGKMQRSTVRVIGATNRDLALAVREGSFRKDLYYRLAKVVVELPPLRRRRDDLIDLAGMCLRRQDGSRQWRMSPEFQRTLLDPTLSWDGNVRQLEDVLEKARLRALARDSRANVLDLAHLRREDLGPLAVPAAVAATPALPPAPPDGEESGLVYRRLEAERDALDRLERKTIEDALAELPGNVSRVARKLGIPRHRLISRIRTLGITLDVKFERA